MTIEQIVEAMARAAAGNQNDYEGDELQYMPYMDEGKASLAALLTAANITEAQLLALANGTAVVVPVEPSAADISRIGRAGRSPTTGAHLLSAQVEAVYEAVLKASACNVLKTADPPIPPHYMPLPPTPFIPMPAKGCICPPGSEATCKRSDCGRKDYKVNIKSKSPPPG